MDCSPPLDDDCTSDDDACNVGDEADAQLQSTTSAVELEE